MHNLPETPAFHYHGKIIESWRSTKLTVLGIDLFKDLHITENTPDRQMVESKHRDPESGLHFQTRVETYAGHPRIIVNVIMTYGDTGDSRAVFARVPVRADFTSSRMVDRPADEVDGRGGRTRHGRVPEIPQQVPQEFVHSFTVDNGVGDVGQGQGLPLLQFGFDFEQFMPKSSRHPLKKMPRGMQPPYYTLPPAPPWMGNHPGKLDDALLQLSRVEETQAYAPFEQTIYTRVRPGNAGDQEILGVWHTLPEQHAGRMTRYRAWQNQLRNSPCRPGHFLHPDGKLVKEEDYPDLVLHRDGWFHPNSKGTPWYARNKGDEMARDPDTGVRWEWGDGQHAAWCVPLCQAYLLYRDEGWAMEIDHIAESFLKAYHNGPQGGTTHWKPGAARERGWKIAALAHLFYCVRHPDLKQRLLVRLQEHLQLQLDDPEIQHRSDGVSVWEHGLWVIGLLSTMAMPIDQDLKEKVQFLGFKIADFVFEHFSYYPDHGWAIPYVLNHDMTVPADPNPSGLAEWCIPSIQVTKAYATPPGLIAEEKVDAILHQYEDERRVEPGWPEWKEWRLH